MKINGSKGIISLPSSSPGGNLNRNANSSMNTFHKTSSKGSAESKDTINNSVGWAFFLENKSASTAELWKEPPQIEVFPVKVLSAKMDLKMMENDINVKAETLRDKIEKRKDVERKKKEDVHDEARRQKQEQENDRKKRHD
jgi:hypothetical protein